MMLLQLILFGATCLAVCWPMVMADCNEGEKACQKKYLELCTLLKDNKLQKVKETCATKDTSTCMEAICKGCENDTCQYARQCRTKAGACVDKCLSEFISNGQDMSKCTGW